MRRGGQRRPLSVIFGVSSPLRIVRVDDEKRKDHKQRCGGTFEISNRAALDEISRLIELKVVKQVGSGRGVRYVLE